MISEMRQHFEEHGWVRLEGVLDQKKNTRLQIHVRSHHIRDLVADGQ